MEPIHAADADAKLERELSKTNLFVMVGVWVVLPKFRQYMSLAIRERVRKLFISPCESLFHVMRSKEGK